jgi:two-component system response regulator TctD
MDRLLLVEDSARLSTLIVNGLSKEGFGIDCVATLAEASDAVSGTHFDAIILDLGLPDGDGMAIVRQVRSSGMSTPILVLTAKLAVEDRVHGLQQGADDYLGKPFAFDELIARIRALLRRPPQFLGSQLRVANLAFDTATKELAVDGKRYAVPPREAAVLEALLRRPNNVVSKKILEDRLYGLSAEGSGNAVEVYIHRLRKQLAEAGVHIAIHTVRGVGYLIKENPKP